jgi:integrase
LKTGQLGLAKSKARLLAGLYQEFFRNIRARGQDGPSPFLDLVTSQKDRAMSSGLTNDEMAAYLSRLFQQQQTTQREVEPEEDLSDHPEQWGPLLSEVVEECLTYCKRKDWAPRSITEYRSIWNNIVCILGDWPPVGGLQRKDCLDLKQTLLYLPKDYFQDAKRKVRKYEGMEAREVAKQGHPEKMTVKNVNKYLTAFGMLLDYCVEAGHIETNPAKGLTIRTPKKPAHEERNRFNDEDIQALFHSKEYTHDKHRNPWNFWLPLLALYTGARLEELCQLLVDDLQAEGGIWIIKIQDNPEKGKRLKTASALRSIPLHPFLVDDLNFPGFVDKVKSEGHEWLWHQLKKISYRLGHAPGRWFSAYRKRCGITDPKKTFHSFRHTLSDILKQQLVEESLIDQLTGHQLKGETMGRYGKPYTTKILYEKAILKLSFNVDLSHLKSSKWVIQ